MADENDEPELDTKLTLSPEGVPSGSLTLRVRKLLDAVFPERAIKRDTVAALAASAVDKATRQLPLSAVESAVLLAQLGPTMVEAARVAERAKRAEAVFADPKLLPGIPVPDEPQAPPGPWNDRWRTGAKLDSEEHIQEMWARILAGQMRQPGRFSLQTLAVLPELDDEIAHKLVTLGAFSIEGRWVPNWKGFTRHYDAAGLQYPWFLRFDSSRLLSFTDSSIGIAQPSLLNAAGRKWHVWAKKAEGSLPIHVLTPAGSDLVELADPVQPAGCVDAIGSWFSERCARVDVSTRHGFQRWEPGIA